MWAQQGLVQGGTMAIMRGYNALLKLIKIIFFENYDKWGANFDRVYLSDGSRYQHDVYEIKV